MKKGFLKKGVRFFALLSSFVLTINTVAFAASYSDVPSNHWAHDSISKMGDMGIMVGDGSGKYYPNLVMDKFYASKCLGALAGYKAVGYTAQEKTYQDNAYDANKSTLNAYNKQYEKWDPTADKEIAYLLEKQIYTVDDLNKFIYTSEGKEVLRGMPKEDAAMYLVKYLGKQSEALSASASGWKRFTDDSSITEANKPYIYYMKSIGLVSGDEKNNFNPKYNVTKAVFATMLNGALQAKTGGVKANGSNTIENISGKLLEKYSSRSAIQIENSIGEKKIYDIAAGTSIRIDGYEKTFDELQNGMSISAVLVNNQLTNLTAASSQTTSYESSQEASPTISLTPVDGTITTVAHDAAPSLSLEVRMLNNFGEVYKETRSYKIPSDCKITRNGQIIKSTDLSKGDIVSLEVSGSSVYVIDARPAEMTLNGTLMEKGTNDTTNTPYYIIKEESGKDIELLISNSTSVDRNNDTRLNWNDLKIGDRVSVKTKYNTIEWIKGTGARSNAEGYVLEIHIYENNISKILFKDSTTSEVKEYGLTSSLVDVYSIRVGDKLRLRLDSWEVDSYTKLEQSLTQNLNGVITTIKSNYIVVTPQGASSGTQISIDNGTYVYDTIERKSTTLSSLKEGMTVYVTYTRTGNAHADSVTILVK